MDKDLEWQYCDRLSRKTEQQAERQTPSEYAPKHFNPADDVGAFHKFLIEAAKESQFFKDLMKRF